MKLNLKKRFSNKTFCVAFAGACVLLLQQLGLGQYLPSNIMEIVNSGLTILAMVGIVLDPTTQGMSDSQTVLEGETSEDKVMMIEKLQEDMEQFLKEQNEEE